MKIKQIVGLVLSWSLVAIVGIVLSVLQRNIIFKLEDSTHPTTISLFISWVFFIYEFPGSFVLALSSVLPIAIAMLLALVIGPIFWGSIIYFFIVLMVRKLTSNPALNPTRAREA